VCTYFGKEGHDLIAFRSGRIADHVEQKVLNVEKDRLIAHQQFPETKLESHLMIDEQLSKQAEILTVQLSPSADDHPQVAALRTGSKCLTIRLYVTPRNTCPEAKLTFAAAPSTSQIV
jgi:hypothetical protein